ncbi:hypothetical protein A3SI_18422 [Nitritalea halalkaliphila LW7]|uniref:YceI family protein n=1 Tax=Nitritalea halalkaliphila LW7 TaxID=1189621 RepID=I5BU30_9BACT|nr:hypothetical protein [Nitritalea halalkaliphila]EIM73082.1 hypothetical protein A3SI_18422 [Nitritalea halalkaliphila LW7]
MSPHTTGTHRRYAILATMAVSLLLLLGSAQRTFAQRTYTLEPEKSSFQVAGTSTLHDWSLTGKKGSGTLEVEVDEGKLKNIAPFTLKLETKSLKSDQDKSAMTEKAHKSLRAEEHGHIAFEAKKVEILSSKRLRVRAPGRSQVKKVPKSMSLTTAWTRNSRSAEQQN